jgi:hypothetical protein
VSRDISSLVFSIKLLLLVLIDMFRNNFDLFRLFAEICIQLFWCFNGVNDTGKACIAGVVNIGENFSPMSVTLVSDAFAIVECYTAWSHGHH